MVEIHSSHLLHLLMVYHLHNPLDISSMKNGGVHVLYHRTVKGVNPVFPVSQGCARRRVCPEPWRCSSGRSCLGTQRRTWQLGLDNRLGLGSLGTKK